MKHTSRGRAMRPHWHAFVLLLLCTLGIPSSDAMAKPLRIVASFSILGDWVKAVAGHNVNLTVLVGADSDAHVFEPRPKHVRITASADLIFVNGLGYESWLQRLIQASGTSAKVVELSAGAELIEFANVAAVGGHEVDPHAWHDVRNSMVYVRNIAASMCTKDPQSCDGFKRNAARYIAELQVLHLDIKAALAKLPMRNPVAVSPHDSFGYFSLAYGVQFIAVKGLSTEAHASARDVARLIDKVRSHSAHGLFLENISDPRLLQQISRETKVQPGGALFSDALSAADGDAPTYIAMMRHNVRTLVQGLAPQ